MRKFRNGLSNQSILFRKRNFYLLVVLILFCGPLALNGTTFAQAPTPSLDVAAAEPAVEETAAITSDELSYVFNNAIIFLCAVLVLFMQAGFSLVEVGLNSAKNVVNILFKNLMDLSIGGILFFIIGFGIMYPGEYLYGSLNPYFSFGGFGLYEAKDGASLSPHASWFFQAVFAATAATIVSGAVAGRMKFSSYLIFSAILTALVYPISGYWKWGGGWLDELGFQDFAGSVVVHAVGGFAGLAGAILLGPRIGRFSKDGKSLALPGHNMTFAALGVFILWVGWYGFNPGSQLNFGTAGDIDATVKIAVTTTLSAAAGAIIATLISWIWLKKPDLSLSLNGALGGLVGITAGCDCFSEWWSMVIGACAGALVVVGVRLLDRLRIDDPVGAWPVHGLCGIWGCLAIGFIPNAHFADPNAWLDLNLLSAQCIGTLAIVTWAFLTMLALFGVLKVCGILRVTEADELAGLDVSEHGMNAYPAESWGGGMPMSGGALATTSAPPVGSKQKADSTASAVVAGIEA
ncbi:MAG: ammonium transporter [Mariniblastus sp.]|nr:ammonium transporter [Mariniblastus sp.]